MTNNITSKYSDLTFGNWNYDKEPKNNQAKHTNISYHSKFYFNIDLWNKRNPEKKIEEEDRQKYPTNDKYFGEGQYGITYIAKDENNKVVKFLLPEDTGHTSFFKRKYGEIIHKGFREQQERDYYENIQWEIAPYQNLKGLPFILNVYYPVESTTQMLRDNNIGYYVMDKLDKTLEQEFLPYDCQSIYKELKKDKSKHTMDDIEQYFNVNLKCNKSTNIFRCMDRLKDYYKDIGKEFKNAYEYFKQRKGGSHDIICDLKFRTPIELVNHLKECHMITTKIPGYTSVNTLVESVFPAGLEKEKEDAKRDLIKINDILYLLQRTPYKHHDLKPQNIMKKGDDWMIIDWGMYHVIPTNSDIWQKSDNSGKWDSQHYKLKDEPDIIERVRASPIIWKYDIHTLYKLTTLLNSLTSEEFNILMKGQNGDKSLIFVEDPIDYYNKHKNEFQIIKCRSNLQLGGSTLRSRKRRKRNTFNKSKTLFRKKSAKTKNGKIKSKSNRIRKNKKSKHKKSKYKKSK